MAPIKTLWVLFDERCGFCCRCAQWLNAQPKRIPLTCLPAGGPQAAFFRALPRDELVVVDSNLGVYRSPDAWLITLWALDDWWEWAARLASPVLRPHARGLFHLVSSRRKSISQMLLMGSENHLGQFLEAVGGEPGCELPNPIRSSAASP